NNVVAAAGRAVGCLACLDEHAGCAEGAIVCHGKPDLRVDRAAHSVEDHEEGAVRVGHQRRIDDAITPAEIEVVAVDLARLCDVPLFKLRPHLAPEDGGDDLRAVIYTGLPAGVEEAIAEDRSGADA